MAIYRFTSTSLVDHTCNYLDIADAGTVKTANGCKITEATYDSLLVELEANESAAAVVGDGWKPASEPPNNSDDVIVYSEESGVGVGYFCQHLRWHQLIAGDYIECKITHWHELPKPPSQTQPEPPKEPEPVWQGPGWYKCIQFREPFFYGLWRDYCRERTRPPHPPRH